MQPEDAVAQDGSVASVVVGIDGSTAVVTAAVRAVDEAISRDVPLRLVHAVDGDDGSTAPGRDVAVAMQYAGGARRAFDAAVQACRKPVKVDTAILRGSADDTTS
jgi:nucleotide-binding universal stress UspA family protein